MNAHLIVEEGKLTGLTFDLQGDSKWFLGRDPDLSNFIIEDLTVSRQHALITKGEDGYFIENFSQKSPLLLNNAPINQSIHLKNGDKIQLGSTIITFYDEDHENLEPQEEIIQVAPEEIQDEYKTIFEEKDETTHNDALIASLDLELRERYLLKIISGPQVGSEFSMQEDKPYIIGSDATLADIILYDLSVSRKHAIITLQKDGSCKIEDLQSRNGIFINNEKIDKEALIVCQDIVQLGTTSFVLIDRDQQSHTIVAAQPIKEEIQEEPKEETPEKPKEKLKEEAKDQVAEIAPVKEEKRKKNRSVIILLFIAFLTLTTLYIGISALFEVKEEIITEKDPAAEIQAILSPFTDVNFTYNKNSNSLFLVGHVLTLVEKSQIQYDLKGLIFQPTVDDTNLIVDQLIWQELNGLIARNPTFVGISMHASKPGQFFITGYLKTRTEYAQLQDFLNLNFPYLDKLQNKVAVEEDILARVSNDLFSQGINSIQVQINNGDLSLLGFIASDKELILQDLIKTWKSLQGVRTIKNYSVPLAPQDAVVDLSSKYRVTGFSTKDHLSVNVVVNGRILAVGDQLDGMTITEIESSKIFLEKDGLKFKIEYNA